MRILPCPAKLPHDLEVGKKVARWFGHPFNAWHVVKIAEVNRRRTRSENVSVEFMSAEEGETRGMFIAEAETYGAERLWVLVEPIPIELGSSSEPSSDDDDD